MKKYKELTVEQVIYLENILRRVKKFRIKKRLVRRISDGVFNAFIEWIEDENKFKEKIGYKMPSNVELITRTWKRNPRED